jgi:hypothetical protein
MSNTNVNTGRVFFLIVSSQISKLCKPVGQVVFHSACFSAADGKINFVIRIATSGLKVMKDTNIKPNNRVYEV